ncbi:MAG: tetratricopeptide repeat protein [Acidobacteriota bacterium]
MSSSPATPCPASGSRLAWHQAALWVVVALWLAACSGDGAPEPDRRAVVIALDGADWTIIDRLAAQGDLPHFSRLRQRGAWGRIETLRDIALSPVIWTSVATGKTAAQHGITWFMVDQPDGTRVPIRSHNRRVKALWNILAGHQRRPIVIGWWASYPAEAVGEGKIVSDALGFHGFGATASTGEAAGKTYPPELFATVDPLVPPVQQLSHDFVKRFVQISAEDYRAEMFHPARHPRPDADNPIHLLQLYATTAQGYTAIAGRLLEDRFDLLMVYFEQIDSLSHLFMKYQDPRLEWIEDDAAVQRYRNVVTEWYRYQDELLGRLLAKIDLDETAVFVLSDHGFKSGERRVRSTAAVDFAHAHLDHEDEGIFLAVGPHIRRGVEVTGASVLDVTPTLLHYLGLPVGKDMAGRVLEALFEPDLAAGHPIRYVSTYETSGESSEPAVAAADGPDAAASASQLAALRSLGYVGSAEKPGEGEPSATSQAGGSSPEVHNNLAQAHLLEGDIEAARRELEKALQLDVNNADALLGLAAIDRAEGKLANATHLAKRALQADPSSIGALAQLAEIERDAGNLDEAARLLEEALRLDGALPLLHVGLGDVLQRAGRPQDAEAAFRRALELDPDSFKAHYNLGVTYSSLGRIDDAMAVYQQALEKDPQNPEAVLAHNNLGVIHLGRGEIEQAKQRFGLAVQSSPAHLESRYNLALIYLETGRPEEAILHLEAAAAIQPNHELVAVRLGLAYLLDGRDEDAYSSLLLVRRLYPDNWLAAVGLAALHARAGQPEEAAGLLEAAISLGGEEARRTAASFPLLKRTLSL